MLANGSVSMLFAKLFRVRLCQAFIFKQNQAMNIFDEFTQIVRNIEENKIRYALADGAAMAFYTAPRFTQDIDLLIEPTDLAHITKAEKFASGSGGHRKAAA